jgi:hypothetical protein
VQGKREKCPAGVVAACRYPHILMLPAGWRGAGGFPNERDSGHSVTL